MRLPNVYRSDRPAHIDVTADSATSLYAANGVDWPVSGDETVRALGYVAVRRATVNLWHLPSVRPKHPTTGIRPGDRITAHGVTGTVTRVGTIAGWMTPDGDDHETRWEAWGVSVIMPAGATR